MSHRRLARRLGFSLLIALSGCSFIDDFDRFHEAKEPRDGALGDASMDAEPDEDAGEGGGDEDASDGQVGDADGEVASGDDLCAGKSDGTACGDGGLLICLKGFCRTSRCGDGFVDGQRGEQCDELNLTRRDGCEPNTCQFSCTVAADCDNGLVCDGDELCDVTRHRCVPDPVSALGKSCPSKMGGQTGTCNLDGYCVVAGCGDGSVGPFEDCDSTPGCRADCTMGCITNAVCDDGDLCNGTETCTVARGECKGGTPLTCADNDPCSLDGLCVPASGCVFPLVDSDGDGVSEQTCAAGSSFRGGDCAGDDSTVYPGASEFCDSKDNNCNGVINEPPVQMFTCYPDVDRDGYPTQQGSMTACLCPAGTRERRSDGLWDCWDSTAGGADVHPGQQAFFGTAYPAPCANGMGTCVSYDYDCNGSPTGRWGAGPTGCGALSLGCGTEGYSGAAPPCGQTKQYLVCEAGVLSCTQRESQRQQLCR